MGQSTTPARRRWLIFAAISIVSLLAAMPGLLGSWVGDDFHMTSSRYYGEWKDVWQVFTRHAGHYHAADGDPIRSGPYRPVTMFTLLLPHALVPAPWLHHLLSWVLHIATGALLYLALLRQESPNDRRSADAVMLVLTGLFVLHPVTVEAYVWINGRSDLVAGFLLAAMAVVLSNRWMAWRWQAFVIALLAFLGAGSKLPFVVAVVALWVGVAFRLPERGPRWHAGPPLFAGLGAYMLLRLVYAPFTGRLGSADNILLDASVWGAAPQLLAKSADALIAFRAESMQSLAWALDQSLSPGEWVGAAALLAAGLGLAWRRDIGGLAYVIGGGLTVLPCVVVSRAIWLGFDRYLYMPWILFLLAGAPYAARAVDAWSSRRALWWGIAATLLLVATLGTRTTSLTYVSQTTYERALLEDHPDDSTTFFYVARTANESSQPEFARQTLSKMPGPPWPRALVMPAFALATELSDSRTRDLAIAHGLEAHPEDPVLRAHGMRWKYRRGEIGDALALARSFEADDALCSEVRRQLELWSRDADLGPERDSVEAAADGMHCAGDPE